MAAANSARLSAVLNCLRVADLSQIVGLLYPASADIFGVMPPGDAWAQAVYKALGARERFTVGSDAR